jgi:hypothetical protein
MYSRYGLHREINKMRENSLQLSHYFHLSDYCNGNAVHVEVFDQMSAGDHLQWTRLYWFSFSDPSDEWRDSTFKLACSYILTWSSSSPLSSCLVWRHYQAALRGISCKDGKCMEVAQSLVHWWAFILLVLVLVPYKNPLVKWKCII